MYQNSTKNKIYQNSTKKRKSKFVEHCENTIFSCPPKWEKLDPGLDIASRLVCLGSGSQGGGPKWTLMMRSHRQMQRYSLPCIINAINGMVATATVVAAAKTTKSYELNLSSIHNILYTGSSASKCKTISYCGF